MAAPGFETIRFALSVADLRQLPPDTGAEIAFAGRSNAGKSSAINAITGVGNLARTSKTPGRTQHINLFPIDAARRLVDLPGYGYAKVPESVKQRWGEVLADYLRSRRCLRGVVLMMDIRHPFKPFDEMLIGWCRSSHMPLHILLTKSDKLKRGPALEVLKAVRGRLDPIPDLKVSVQLFSALKQTGVEDARAQVLQMLEGE